MLDLIAVLLINHILYEVSKNIQAKPLLNTLGRLVLDLTVVMVINTNKQLT